MHLIQKLYLKYPEEIRPSLKLCMLNASYDTKIQAAKYLCQMGDHDGFLFLIDRLTEDKKVANEYLTRVSIRQIDTAFALNKLENLVFLLIEKDNESLRSFESPRVIITEWIFELASKSEEDTKMVYEYLLAKEAEAQKTVINHKDFFWYAFKTIENFRNADDLGKSIFEIKSVLSVLN
jgi:hypothetical protein